MADLTDLGVESAGELVRLVSDDTKLPPSARDSLREVVWRMAGSSFEFFLEYFWHVQVIGKGYQLMVPRDYQRDEAKVFEAACLSGERPREVRLKARQIGMTTLDAGGAFWNAFFNEHHPWMLSSQGEDEAKKTLNLKIRTPYSMLPVWLRERGPQIERENSELLAFSNHSYIESIPATAAAGRSSAVFGTLLDEFAFAEYADDMLAALDPMCYGPMFVFSTANGMGNAFHQKWVDASRPDSEWNRLSRMMRGDRPHNGAFLPWSEVPGRDDKWYEREKRKYRGKEHLFYQEYPESPEEAFSKTGRPAISLDLLRQQEIGDPFWRYDLGLVDFAADQELPGRALIPDGVDRDWELWVWAHPDVERHEDGSVKRKPNYVMAVDTAEGLDHGDRTSIVIADANNREVVATFRGHYPIEDLDELLEWLAHRWFQPVIGVERNNHGILPIEGLRRRAYTRLYRMASFARTGGGRATRYGWMTSKATKPKMVNDFNGALRDDTIALHDPRLLEEAQTFVQDGKGGYGATRGTHDDHVIGHMICLQLMDDVGMYPITWVDSGPKRVTWADMDPDIFTAKGPRSALSQGINQGPMINDGGIKSFVPIN